MTDQEIPVPFEVLTGKEVISEVVEDTSVAGYDGALAYVTGEETTNWVRDDEGELRQVDKNGALGDTASNGDEAA